MMAAVPPYSRKATRLQLSLQSDMVVYHNFTAMFSAMSRRVSVLTGALESHFSDVEKNLQFVHILILGKLLR